MIPLNFLCRRAGLLALCIAALLNAPVSAQTVQPPPGATPPPNRALVTSAPTRTATKPVIVLRGLEFFHRGSNGPQHEFTPRGQENMSQWKDMVTLVQYPQVTSGDALAKLAGELVARYQQGGAKVLSTRPIPAAAGRPAEHFLSVYFSKGQAVEIVFARLLLHQGSGLAAIYSHRETGPQVGGSIQTWLNANGASSEQSLLRLLSFPALPPAR